MPDDESSMVGAAGLIVIFSFVSIIFIFMAMLLIGSLNNYALAELVSIGEDSVTAGSIPSLFFTLFGSTAETYLDILPYLDLIWFMGFVSLIISSVIFSYVRKRENYFSLFTMSVLGIILFTYVGGIIIQLTDWFRLEILLAVFPTFTGLTPIFSWYLDHIGLINLFLIVLNIIANFVDLDFSRFNKRKSGEDFNEI